MLDAVTVLRRRGEDKRMTAARRGVIDREEERGLRRFRCGKCRELVIVCRYCDRGDRYCGPACADAVREESKRRARRKYQTSLKGARRHAERQREYRRCRRRRVMDQGLLISEEGGRLPVSVLSSIPPFGGQFLTTFPPLAGPRFSAPFPLRG